VLGDLKPVTRMPDERALRVAEAPGHDRRQRSWPIAR